MTDITDKHLDHLFAAAPPPEPIQPADLAVCWQANCRYYIGDGRCEFLATDMDVTGADCDVAEIDEKLCDECGEEMVEVTEVGYGTDIDGNRGTTITLLECPNPH